LLHSVFFGGGCAVHVFAILQTNGRDVYIFLLQVLFLHELCTLSKTLQRVHQLQLYRLVFGGNIHFYLPFFEPNFLSPCGGIWFIFWRPASFPLLMQSGFYFLFCIFLKLFFWGSTKDFFLYLISAKCEYFVLIISCYLLMDHWLKLLLYLTYKLLTAWNWNFSCISCIHWSCHIALEFSNNDIVRFAFTGHVVDWLDLAARDLIPWRKRDLVFFFLAWSLVQTKAPFI
jgi:hypothetical protein